MFIVSTKSVKMGYYISGGKNAAFETRISTRIESWYPIVLHKGKIIKRSLFRSETGEGANP